MTDQAQTEPAPNASGEQWTRRKAVAIVTAAWAALGAFAVLVTACSIIVANLLFGDGTGKDAGFLPYAVSICLIFLVWLVVMLIGTRNQPQNEDGIDFAEVMVRPILPIFAVLAVTGSASVVVSLYAGMYGYIAVTGMLPMLMGATLIDVHLGPQIRRRCPDLWAKAVKRWESRGRHMEVMGQALAAVITLVPVLLIVFIIAKALLGD